MAWPAWHQPRHARPPVHPRREAPTLAAATNISAFNIGITAGPWLGGLALATGAQTPALAWITALLALLALATVATLQRPRPRAPAALRRRADTTATAHEQRGLG